MKAHQRIVREEKATLYTDYPRDVCISSAEVKEVDRATAKGIIEEYEWLGCMAAVNWYYYGIFFDGVCAGVVVYGQEYIKPYPKRDPTDKRLPLTLTKGF